MIEFCIIKKNELKKNMGHRKIDTIMAMGESPNLIEDEDKAELEEAFRNLEFQDIEDYEKVEKDNTEILKQTIKKLVKQPEFRPLRFEIVELGGAVMNKDNVLDANKKMHEQKITGHIQAITSIIKNTNEDVRGAYVLVMKDYVDYVGEKFSMKKEVLDKLKSDLWKGIRESVIGAGLAVGGVFVMLQGSSLALATAAVGLTTAIGALAAMAGIFLLGLGLWKLWKWRKENNEAKNCLKFAEMCKKMFNFKEADK